MTRALMIFAALASAAMPLAAATIARADALDGVYIGSMHLTDGTVRDIPLSVSLTVTPDTVPCPPPQPVGCTVHIIDGSFVVDEEGGPYTFTDIVFNVNDANNELDLRYSRPRADPTTTAPLAFRLIGAIDANDHLIGRVYSGLSGQIGTFDIAHSTTVVSLQTKQKYKGVWVGSGYNEAFGTDATVELRISAGLTPTINPPNMEFDFTPGKVASYYYNGIAISGFPNASIDYLRRTIVLSAPATSTEMGGLAVQATFDFEHMTLTGQQNSDLLGETTTFVLHPMPN